MTTLDPATAKRARRHEHESVGDARCPYCGQSISHQEFDEIRTRIEGEERARIAKVEQALKDRFARERAQTEATAKAGVTKAKRDAAKVAEQRVKAVMASQEAVIAQRLQQQRDTLDKAKAEAVGAEKVRHFEEKTRLVEQLNEMQRRLEKKTAYELGEPAEVDLYDALVAAFPHDRVIRIAKGVRGPDIFVGIVQNGEVAGLIVVECKNHLRWSNKFTSTLRAHQIAEGAEFAILASACFPRGARQLHVQDGVIVADPARTIALVTLLRQQIVRGYLLKLGVTARNEKAEALLAYIVSAPCTDLFDQLRKVADDLINLEAKEVDAHHGVWRRRGELIRAAQRVHEDLSEAIDRIIRTTEMHDLDNAKPLS